MQARCDTRGWAAAVAAALTACQFLLPEEVPGGAGAAVADAATEAATADALDGDAAATPDGGVVLDAASFCPTPLAMGSFCTTFDDPSAPFGNFWVADASTVTQSFDTDASLSPPSSWHLTTLGPAAGAPLEVRQSSPANIRCQVAWRLEAHPPVPQDTAIIAFRFAPESSVVFALEAAGTVTFNRVTPGAVAAKRPVDLDGPDGWHRVVMEYDAKSATVVARVIGGGAATFSVAELALPLTLTQLGLVQEVPGWNVRFDDFRCDVRQ